MGNLMPVSGSEAGPAPVACKVRSSLTLVGTEGLVGPAPDFQVNCVQRQGPPSLFPSAV